MIVKISKDKFYLPKGSHTKYSDSIKAANAMAVELMQYGTIVDSEILDRLATFRPNKAKELANGLLKKYTLGKLNKPLFGNNWEDRVNFSFGDVVVQIFAYVLSISGNDLNDPSYMDNLLKDVEVKDFKRLSFSSKDAAYEEFLSLLISNVKLDRETAKKFQGLAKRFVKKVPELEITSSQIKSILAVEAVKAKADLEYTMNSLNFNWADTIRYAAAKVDIDKFNLPSDVKYGNLSWSERNAILKRLSEGNMEDLAELFSKNQRAWKSFFKHIHLFSQRQFNKYERVKLAHMIAGGVKQSVLTAAQRKQVAHIVEKVGDEGGMKTFSKRWDKVSEPKLVYRSFESRVKSAIDDQDVETLIVMLEKKHSYVMRNLTMLCNAVKPGSKNKFLNMVKNAIKNTDASSLFSLIQINVDASHRIIDAKGRTTVQPANYPLVFKDIQKLCRKEIKDRYGVKGKIQVDESIKDEVVPFLVKNSELNRGTRVPLTQSSYLYFLVHWIQETTRTDIDHSVLAFNSQGTMVDHIAYYDSACSYMKSSGDITDAPAPKGATEYCRIDMKKIPNDVRYIIPMINVYSGDTFNKMNTCYAAWMETDRDRFNLNQDHTRFDLVNEVRGNVPFIIDVHNQEIIILDFNLENATRHAVSSLGTINDLISAASSMNPLTIGELGEMLSGSGKTVYKKFVSEKKGSNEYEPDSLFTLFN